MKKTIIVIILVLILAFSLNALASEPGDTIQVTLTLNVTNAAAFDASLEYSSELTFVSAAPSVGYAGGKGWSYAAMTTVSNPTIVYTFKVKEDAKEGFYYVKLVAEGAYGADLSSISVSGGSKTVTVGNPHVHTVVEDPAKAATCTESGLTVGYHCSVCNEVLQKQEVVPALGHKEAAIAAVAPTCTETGLTEGTKCSVCGVTIKAQETVAALGHTEEAIAAVAPTCTETGLTEGAKCSVCGEIIKAQETVAALGHTEEAIEAVAPTCTETGLTEGVKCSVCEEILTAQEEVAALGHSEETMPAKAATCTAKGLTEGVKCSVCGTVLTAQKSVKALGHNYSSKVVEPTEAADGYTQYTCRRCGYSYKDKIVAKLAKEALEGISLTDENNEERAYEWEKDEKALTITCASDEEIRKLHITVEALAALKAEGIEEIVFVVNAVELRVPAAAFDAEAVVAAKDEAVAELVITVADAEETAVTYEWVVDDENAADITELIEDARLYVNGEEVIAA